MQYLEIIEKELPSLLSQIHHEIENDETIYEFVKEDSVKEALAKQKELLYEFFTEYKNQEIDEFFCWNFYKKFDIPFPIVYKSLNSLKIKLVKKLINQLDDKNEIFEIENFINNLLSIVSKVYIKKDIVNLDMKSKPKFKEYLLFHAHIEWLEKLIKSIKEDDLSIFPLGSSEECSFNAYLEYPESLMVCIDANLCTYLHDVHALVHKNANTLYLFYSRKEYYQAYMVYKELLENIVNFNKTIVELYFLTYNNLEESFFKLIELLLYQKSNIHLTLIDIKKLKILNNTYGEITVNLMLENLDKKLQELVHDREKDVLLIKGSTADYYMLDIGLSREELMSLNEELYKIVNGKCTVNSKDIEIKSTIVTLSLKGFYEKNRDDLTKMMLYLKEEAKQKSSSYHIDSETDKERLNSWLNRSYRDREFISKKLQNSEIDLYFQPIYNIKTGKAEVLEALVRIRDANKLIPAGVFIDTIYEMDKIELLDRLVLEKLIEKQEDIKRLAPVLFINISYKSLFDQKYKKAFKEFMKIFKDHKVIFELTEQNIVENIDEILKVHKEYGLNFAVDDFGSGYSSLKSVSDLAREGVLKVLKMDGEIIKSIDYDKFTQKIVKVISELSKTLELYSVAEFIESEEVLSLVKGFGVNYAQGYFLSKPKSIESLLVEKFNGILDFKY